MNNFITDLEYSLEERENRLFDKFYYRAFKGLMHIKLVSDLGQQREGIDKVLHFSNGKQLLIDEKKRRKDYGDILLEEWSIVEQKKKGWVGDSKKKTDYIVYAIMPSQKVYLFPYLLLQAAWRKHYLEWKKNYRTQIAKNIGYNTSFLCIPPPILISAIKNEMEQTLKDNRYGRSSA